MSWPKRVGLPSGKPPVHRLRKLTRPKSERFLCIGGPWDKSFVKLVPAGKTMSTLVVTVNGERGRYVYTTGLHATEVGLRNRLRHTWNNRVLWVPG